MKSNPEEFPNNILDTEGGMFQMEIMTIMPEALQLIEISQVNEEIKEKCKLILDDFVKVVKFEKDKIDPYILSKGPVIKLLDLLDEKDDEQKQLFESLRDVILKARDSVKGWKS
ncbi:hypothetical protein H0W91_02655 [Patescibacteria group bacterium]|nr:hypothetical protein [Patescibacteria group bacterium]